mgnify:CR=1 FL=1|tara:strand:+ start:26 stop:781 length:756 start_codon:yes stop_codon:yes gene_type:complete
MSEIRKIAGKEPVSQDDILKELFKDAPASESWQVTLPSKGRFYTNFRGASVSPLTYQDEERILNSKGQGTELINLLVEACVTGVTMSEVVPMDKLFLLMKIREISYGSEYKFSVGCPSCNTEIKTSLDLGSHFIVNEVPEDLTDPREVVLPKLGVTAKVRFPRTQDESYLSDSKVLISNLYRFIESLGKYSDPLIISKAVNRMHIQDIKKIIKEVHKDEYGIDPRFMFECPSCKHSTMMSVPLGADFFSVS